MHQKAQEKAFKIIIGSLKNCAIKDNWPQYESFSVHVESLAKEILKHKKEHLDSTDVFTIFYDFAYDAIRSVVDGDKKLEGNLWDLLGEERCQQIAETLKNYFVSIPRTFDIFIPIPEISQNIPTPIDLSETISLISFQMPDEIPGGYQVGLMQLFNKFEVGKVYIRQRASGYSGGRLENMCVKRALTSLNIILQQGVAGGFFKLTPEKQAGLGFLGSLSQHSIKKSSVVSVDNAYQEPKVSKVELPLDTCRFLNSVDINWEHKAIALAVKTNAVEKAIQAMNRRPIQLIECQDEEAKGIKSAINWCFNSYVTENSTLSFLQVCIGLEALLGDTKDNGALTETLADRCSYLIGKSIKARNTIKNNFKQLYSVRSKLVHGNVTELNTSESGYLAWGRQILERAISIEIANLDF
ncbi:hypothetical protein ACFL3A_04565 [Pseudomonadota bacterium]